MKAVYGSYANRLVLLFVACCTAPSLAGQDPARITNHSVALKSQFLQIKDAFNYGLVHNGFNIAGAYTWDCHTEKSYFACAPDLSFGLNFKKGTGITLHTKPVDLFYGWILINSTVTKLTIGPYFSASYNWQFYPQLQSGHMFWFTSMEAGPRIFIHTPVKSRVFRICFSNSVAGWNSRPVPATETYFYSMKFADFISNAHSHMKFGSFELFNHTQLIVESISRKDKRLSLAYEFEYFGYYPDPRLSYITHSIQLKWIIGKR